MSDTGDVWNKAVREARGEPLLTLGAVIEIVRGQAIAVPISDAQEDYNRGVEAAAKILEDMLLAQPWLKRIRRGK